MQFPDNGAYMVGAYMVAAYVIVAVVVLVYAVGLIVRVKKES
jgi:hypothetical protein